ncbi:MAG: phosphate transport system permease protein [Thermoleophilaceae bacterium]|nr:phosphate transport system permease protein [Thermoleophilaceae bacterium]
MVPSWTDERTGRLLGALVCAVLLTTASMLVFVVVQGWPSFAHNGLHWFGSGGSVDVQIRNIFLSGETGAHAVYTFHGWPLIWSTILITGGAVVISLIVSLFVSAFIVEFAPEPVRAVLRPVIGLLAAVPSVIYGLIGVLVIVPFIGNNLISQSARASKAGIISLSGYSLLAAVVILTVMISPLMVAVFSDGMRTVPSGWVEGSLGLGVNRWRTFWKIVVRTARPAIVAGTVLAAARAIGEAVMLAMVSGSVGFAPNPGDGWLFFVEPSRPLAPTIIKNSEELSSPPMHATLFAIAAVLLLSAALFSLVGWAAKQPMKKYGVRA